MKSPSTASSETIRTLSAGWTSIEKYLASSTFQRIRLAREPHLAAMDTLGQDARGS